MAERHGFHEAHFTSLPCQSNVYGLTSLMYPGGIGKVLVAPLKDKVVSLEYMTDQERGKLKPVAKEIHFAGIPDDAEIISIHSYKRLKKDGGHIIGITFTKDAQTENPTHNLNIYAPWEKGSEYVLENIAQTWTNIELDFTPFFLCHTEIMEDGKGEMVFLLTGSDKQVHMYRDTVQTWNEVGSRFSEHPISGSFPEFADLPCVALWLDCRTLGDRKRVSVVGCRSGYIRLSIVDTKSNEIVKQWHTHHDSAITCCRLFTRTTHVESASSWLQRRQERILDDERGSPSQEEGNHDYSLLVTSALEVAAVYGNVLQDGFQHQSILPQSDVFDCALCTSVADLDWDGYNELLVGTYGQCTSTFQTKKQVAKSSNQILVRRNETVKMTCLRRLHLQHLEEREEV
ncbi:KICSTOR complex protein kaptin-like [Diadema antillarum]|uniref:KICSTOR complex protein kaptin-like n=1 Tax=Diadema antillarum TaxID=105358 RepID=UPI003A86DAE6